MLKRITRYTLLIACLLIVGVWGWSVWHIFGVEYVNQFDWWGIKAQRGHLVCSMGRRLIVWQDGWNWHNYVYRSSNSLYLDFGLALPTSGTSMGKGVSGTTYWIAVPIWTGCLALTLLSAAMWYRPIRNRLRGKHDAGFPVEMKKPEPVRE
ncbi:MAG: hypothetical protein H7144_02095 [Burkholderiales bacterium]|nr:hypothetical protein [Phycisphaerae bacterium]